MAAKIEQFRKLQVVGEPLVLYNIWDPVVAQEPKEQREFPER
jgi:2-methylisocitrate lyase-like PEP mutase family enzyme